MPSDIITTAVKASVSSDIINSNIQNLEKSYDYFNTLNIYLLVLAGIIALSIGIIDYKVYNIDSPEIADKAKKYVKQAAQDQQKSKE